MLRWRRFSRRTLIVVLLIAAGCLLVAQWPAVDAEIRAWSGGVPTHCPKCRAKLEREDQAGSRNDGTPYTAVWLHCRQCRWTPSVRLLDD